LGGCAGIHILWHHGLQTLSVLVGIWVAIAGLGVWRQEYLSKRRIELAEDWLSAAYAFKDAIRSVRNPFSPAGEGSSRPKGESDANDTPTLAEAKNRGYVFFERYEKVRPTITDFFKIKYRVMARFGRHTEEIYLKAHKVESELGWAANTLARHWYQSAQSSGLHQGKTEGYITKAEDLIWWSGDEDKVQKRLEDLVAEIEAEVKKVNAERYGLAEILNMPFGKKRN
jgi:hypothetical protein